MPVTTRSSWRDGRCGTDDEQQSVRRRADQRRHGEAGGEDRRDPEGLRKALTRQPSTKPACTPLVSAACAKPVSRYSATSAGSTAEAENHSASAATWQTAMIVTDARFGGCRIAHPAGDNQILGRVTPAAPDTCRPDPCTTSRTPRPTRRRSPAPRLRWRRSSRASGVVFENSSVTKPSHSGSSGVTLTMMPQRAYVRFSEADREHVARNAEVLDRARQRERVGRNDADVAVEIDEGARVERLGIDDRRVDVGEDLEFAASSGCRSRSSTCRTTRSCGPSTSRIWPASNGSIMPRRSRHPADPFVGL